MESTEEVGEQALVWWEDSVELLIALGIAVAVSIVVTIIVTLVFRLIAKRSSWPGSLIKRARNPFRAVVLLLSLIISLQFVPSDNEWLDAVRLIVRLAMIGAAAWLLGALVYFVGDLALGRYRVDVPDNRVARRIRTQTLILRRLAVAIIVIIAIGAILLQFDAVRAVGASVLASAGVASVVAGLAAQTVLANLFAGIQLVFTEAIRVDDVVVVEGEWGRVSEITLSYVVVHIWDDRRLILPCTYFTTTPFENWTRTGSELLGAVELDLDWRVSPARMRTHLNEYLATSELWDGRASVLQITDATGGAIRVRILVTAQDSASLFDLRCNIRESMVAFVQREIPNSLPVQRVLLSETDADESPYLEPTPTSGGLFSGSAEAEERAASYTQAVPVQRQSEDIDVDAAVELGQQTADEERRN